MPRLGWLRAGLGKAYPHAHRRPFAGVPRVLRAAGRQLHDPRRAAHQRDPRLPVDAPAAAAEREADPHRGRLRLWRASRSARASTPSTRAPAARRRPSSSGQIPLIAGVRSRRWASDMLTKQDYEADDILASLATRGVRGRATRCYVVSGDRDAHPAGHRRHHAALPERPRGHRAQASTTAPRCVERYGIEPEQYPDIAALVGETSDNLIGIDKVGEKTAVKWITQYGGLDELLAHADEITGRRRAEPARPAGPRRAQPQAQPAGHRPRAGVRPGRPHPPADGRGGGARAVRPAPVPHPDRPDRQDAGGRAGRQPRRRPRRSVSMPSLPPVQELTGAALGGVAGEGIGERVPRRSRCGRRRRTARSPDSGSPPATRRSGRRGRPTIRRNAGLEAWLAGDAPKILQAAKPQLKLVRGIRARAERHRVRHDARRVAHPARGEGRDALQPGLRLPRRAAVARPTRTSSCPRSSR